LYKNGEAIEELKYTKRRYPLKEIFDKAEIKKYKHFVLTKFRK